MGNRVLDKSELEYFVKELEKIEKIKDLITMPTKHYRNVLESHILSISENQNNKGN